MSTIKQYTSAGEAAADLTVDEAQLVLDKGAQALKDAVDAIRAGMRAGTGFSKPGWTGRNAARNRASRRQRRS